MLALSLGSCAIPAKAGLVYTYTGNNNHSLPVDVKAELTISSGQLVVTLTNYYANPTADNQTLNGVVIEFGSSPGDPTGATGMPPSAKIQGVGNLIQINPDKSVTDVPDNTDPWNAATVGTKFTLSSIGNMGGAPTIIGPGPYSNANSSITVASHQPFFLNTATFTIAMASLPANATVTSLTFRFGTDTSDTKLGVPMNPVPEPATVASAASALFMLVGYRALRRRRVG